MGATEYTGDGVVFNLDGPNGRNRLQRGHEFAIRALSTTADVALTDHPSHF